MAKITKKRIDWLERQFDKVASGKMSQADFRELQREVMNPKGGQVK